MGLEPTTTRLRASLAHDCLEIVNVQRQRIAAMEGNEMLCRQGIPALAANVAYDTYTHVNEASAHTSNNHMIYRTASTHTLVNIDTHTCISSSNPPSIRCHPLLLFTTVSDHVALFVPSKPCHVLPIPSHINQSFIFTASKPRAFQDERSTQWACRPNV